MRGEETFLSDQLNWMSLLWQLRANGGHVKAKGTIYLSSVRMVFVASKPVENFLAFDIPLLYVHGEKFNQPIFHCNNISGQVEPLSKEVKAYEGTKRGIEEDATSEETREFEQQHLTLRINASELE